MHKTPSKQGSVKHPLMFVHGASWFDAGTRSYPLGHALQVTASPAGLGVHFVSASHPPFFKKHGLGLQVVNSYGMNYQTNSV